MSTAREEAARLEQERKAVEAKEELAREQSALATAEMRLAVAESKLKAMQIKLAGDVQQASQDLGADGDRSSSSSESEAEEEILNSGDKACFFLACLKFARYYNKSIYRCQ